MRVLKTLAVAAALAAPLLAATAPAMAAEEDALVKFRKNTMGIVGGSMQNIVAQLQGKAAMSDQIEAYATILHQASTLTIDAFREQAMGMEERTTATAEVWSDWERFEGGFKKMEEEAAKLVTVAASGNMGAIGGQVQALGQTCKNCHDNFRQK